MENWLITLIRQAQQNHPAVPGIIDARDDGGPTRADRIYASLPSHAQGAFDRLEIDKQLLSLSSPEEIAVFARDRLPPSPGTPAPPASSKKQIAVFVSETPRGFRHRTYAVSGPALCGAAPEQSKWKFRFEEPSAMASRNCEACRLRDSNEERP